MKREAFAFIQLDHSFDATPSMRPGAASTIDIRFVKYHRSSPGSWGSSSFKPWLKSKSVKRVRCSSLNRDQIFCARAGLSICAIA